MMNNLVLVESPTKSRTLQRFLGDKFRVDLGIYSKTRLSMTKPSVGKLFNWSFLSPKN